MTIPTTTTPNGHNQQYWTDDNWQALAEATSFTDLLQIAISVLGRLPQPISQVCGPISNGGHGSIKANLKEFNDTIGRLSNEGKTVFDQMPFEEKIFGLSTEDFGEGEKTALLSEFYLPIFNSGRIKTLYFIPGWESSDGARWEHEQAEQLGIAIVYL